MKVRRDLRERKIDVLGYYKSAIWCLAIFFTIFGGILWLFGEV